MQSKHTMFAAAIVALAVMTAPALAGNSASPGADEMATSPSSCHAYQQAADGTWKELPCQEMGRGSGAPAQRKSATRKSDDTTRTR
jgi:hypothetical protein